MIYRALDANGDYTFGGGSNNFLSSSTAVAQAIRTHLRLLQYEWWEDLENGLPLFSKILGYNSEKTATDKIKNRILDTQGVASIISSDTNWNPDTRSLTFTAAIETDYETVISLFISSSSSAAEPVILTVIDGGTAAQTGNFSISGGGAYYHPDFVYSGGNAEGD